MYGTWWADGIDPSAASADYERAWRARFSREIDESGLSSESNVLRYRPLDRVVARVGSSTGPTAEALRAAACVSGVSVEFSVVGDEDEPALIRRIRSLPGESRLRLLTEASDDVLAAAHSHGVAVDRSPVTPWGELELPHWLKEQSVSRSMHRYGRLLPRG
jgi:RHH-type proline utilization regulon transcriptional repressor/proline dehydrogenase/delta 1-pyrroline-5-carboxylate dehydrogenase